MSDMTYDPSDILETFQMWTTGQLNELRVEMADAIALAVTHHQHELGEDHPIIADIIGAIRKHGDLLEALRAWAVEREMNEQEHPPVVAPGRVIPPRGSAEYRNWLIDEAVIAGITVKELATAVRVKGARDVDAS